MKDLKHLADIPIRLTVGFHLIYGTVDNIFSWERMLEFEKFLFEFGVPFPLISAVISVYAQCVCGVLFIVGWRVKVAALVMIFNFAVAILLVHIGDPYPNVYPAISMLAGSTCLLLNGESSIGLSGILRKYKA